MSNNDDFMRWAKFGFYPDGLISFPEELLVGVGNREVIDLHTPPSEENLQLADPLGRGSSGNNDQVWEIGDRALALKVW